MKKIIGTALLCTVLLIGGCGTAGNPGSNSASQQDGYPAIKEVSGREIIAELKQTAEHPSAREAAAQKQWDSPDFQDGLYENKTEQLKEDMTVQAIEGPIALKTAEEIYGGDKAFEQEGVMFLENQINGAEQSGVWIGIKHPDERVQQLIDALQPKVDAGEILAEPIYIFRAQHTTAEQYAIQEKVMQAIEEMQQDRGSYSVYVAVETGIVEIGHDFLKPEQQEAIRNQFPDYTFNFTQEGNMVAEPGKSAVIQPDEPVTDKPVEDGGFIMEVKGEQFLVAGGTEGAVYYSFPEADQLTVGQRVKVEATGAMLESYPGQGAAKFVTILPDYQPAGAVLSEQEVVAKAIEDHTLLPYNFLEIKEIHYVESRHVWILTLIDDSKLEMADR